MSLKALRREPAGEPIGYQPLQHGRFLSKLVAGGSPPAERLPLQRLGINGGLQHRPQLLAALQDAVVILNFFNEKKRLRHRKKLQRALSRRWLHTQICDLKTQPAHAAHQPQAAHSQPNARGGRRSRSARGPAAWLSASNRRRAIA